jgi:putative acetyltransferase
MAFGPDFAREMKADEDAQVTALLDLAFGGPAESRLVQALRKSRVIAGETVLPYQGQIIGYFALSYMVKPKGWLCLAPVAIHPDWQGKHHGQRMMGLLSEWARISQTPVVVLGDPTFYTRCGFSLAMAANLTSPYPIDHTMLAGVAGKPPREALVYHPAFGES